MAAMRVLIVAGNADTREKLLDTFDHQDEEYQVEGVPSGEDALLEFARRPVEVLVTDLDLPGMSGLELVAWSSQLNPHSRTIIFASAPDDAALEQARSLGVAAFLAKPVSSERLREAVARAKEELEAGEIPASSRRSVSVQLIRMMARARRVLGAAGVMILDVMGDVIASEGSVSAIDIETLQSSLASVLGAGLEVSSWLGSHQPWAFHVFEGVDRGCYVTNVGGQHGLVIYFESQRTPGQQEAAVQYCRDAVKTMAPLVKRLSEAQEAEPEDPGGMMMDHEESQDMRERLEQGRAGGDRVDPESFWEEASMDMHGEEDLSEGVMSYDEARERGLLSEEPESPDEE